MKPFKVIRAGLFLRCFDDGGTWGPSLNGGNPWATISTVWPNADESDFGEKSAARLIRPGFGHRDAGSPPGLGECDAQPRGRYRRRGEGAWPPRGGGHRKKWSLPAPVGGVSFFVDDHRSASN